MKESKVLIFKNNGLDKYSKWLLNDQFPIYSLRDYDKIIVKNNYLTFEYKTDTDDRFNNQHYLTFKLMNNGIYLHKFLFYLKGTPNSLKQKLDLDPDKQKVKTFPVKSKYPLSLPTEGFLRSFPASNPAKSIFPL